MLILGIHSGWQDAGAVLFDDYRPLAAITSAQLTGVPRDGGRMPLEAMAECLAIAGVRHTEIGGVALSPGVFPSRYFRKLPLGRRLRRGLRALTGRETPVSLHEEAARSGERNPAALLDTAALLGDLGLNRNIPVRFYGPHRAQGLIPLFGTAWQDALLFTVSGDGERPGCEARLLKFGRLADIDAACGNLAQLLDLAVDGLGLPDQAALLAMAPYGEPILAQALLAHIQVDGDGVIALDFAQDGGAAGWLRRLAEGHPEPVVAASLFKAVEDTLVLALGRLAQRFETTRIALGGAMFGDARLVYRLAERLQPCELAAQPAGDYALPLGGALDFLAERDGMAQWLAERGSAATGPVAPPAWPAMPTGRDFAADIDPVLGNAGCRLVSQDPLRAAAALLNAGKLVAHYGRQAFGPGGGTARAMFFAGDQAGRAAAANDRLDRPAVMPPRIHAAESHAQWLLETASIVQPYGHGAPLLGRLNPVLRSRFAAALSPDLFCQVQPVSRDSDPQLAALLEAVAALSGLPALLSLPLQIGNEPRLDAPKDALRLLRENRVDYVMTENAVWERG